MRELSETLLAAQQRPGAVPYVKVEASNLAGGVVRLDWQRLYEGSEDDCGHAVALPSDGSLVRARLTPPGDARKLYLQRVASPGPGSDFSQWSYTGQYNAVVVAAAARGAEVSVLWIKTNREVRRIVSTDGGATWGSPELVDYSPSTLIYGLAAAYTPAGDLAIFFADQATLYVKKYVSGQWQARTAWDKSTGDLSGVACAYDGDWDLLVTGVDGSGNYRLWSLVYGDGGAVTAGTWSPLVTLAAAPSGGDFSYARPFLDKPDVYRAACSEIYAGSVASQRPCLSRTVPGADFTSELWTEPVPFDFIAACGLALCHDDDYAWLTHPAGVWRAPLAAQTLDLTDDVVAVRLQTDPAGGTLAVDLRNDDGRYASPGQDDLAALVPGNSIAVAPGCVTPAGQESSPGLSFRLERLEHVSAGGVALLRLHGRDAQAAVGEWQARYQFRWNKSAGQTCVRDIIAAVLARAGLTLEVLSASDAATDLCPAFTINPGADGRAVLRRLLLDVPDVLFFEGSTAYLLHPQPGDAAVYSYGTGHPVFEGSYSAGALPRNRVRVEGLGAGGRIIADSFAWDEVGRFPYRGTSVIDTAMTTAGDVEDLGEARLRQGALEASAGSIVVPVNCGQQLHDVVSITDVNAGLAGVSRRVVGLTITWDTRRALYRQRLELGAV